MLPATIMQKRLKRLVVGLVLLSAVVVGLAVAIVVAVVNRPVAWAPDGEKLTSLAAPQVLTEAIVTANSEMLLGRLETWGYPTVKAVPDAVADWIHPQLLPELRKAYEDIEFEARRGRLYRAAVASRARIIERTQDLWTVVIPYRETVWYGTADRTSEIQSSTASWKVARFELVQLGATDANPYGLRLTRRPANFSRKEWGELRRRQSALPDLFANDQAEVFVDDPSARADKIREDAEKKKSKRP